MPTLESGSGITSTIYNLRLREGLVPQRNVRMQVAEEKALGCKKKKYSKVEVSNKRVASPDFQVNIPP